MVADRPRTIARTLAIAIALIALAGCVPTRAIEATRLLAAVGSEPEQPAARREVAFGVEGREHAGDLYEPEPAARAGLVLVPGAAPAGRGDPRLIGFADALREARFRVLVPEIANLRALKVRAADAGIIADAARWLDETTPERPIGIAAISYAVGPAIIAAASPPASDVVDFVLGIGGYHDVRAAFTFATTGAWREHAGAPWRYAEPNPYGAWVFVLSNLDRLESARDREALERIARRRLADPEAPIDDLARDLGPEAESVLRLVTNRDPDRVAALIAALPADVRAEIAALDLARRDLAALRARLLLVHGANDDIIPASESRALARRVPGSFLYVVPGFGHVGTRPSPLAYPAMWRAAYRLLSLRDGEGLAEGAGPSPGSAPRNEAPGGRAHRARLVRDDVAALTRGCRTDAGASGTC